MVSGIAYLAVFLSAYTAKGLLLGGDTHEDLEHWS